MLLAKTLSWYKRREVQDALIQFAENKEIGVRFLAGGFGKRPDTLQYPRDILEHAKNRVSSFHVSEETWSNPLQISSSLPRKELDKLRIGWDLVLDIDCAVFEYSRLAADLTIKALQHHGIKGITCKFSGNKGFHIAVPFESFPDTIQGLPTKELFPEAPRRLALYLKHMIKQPLANAILELEGSDLNKILDKVKLSSDEVLKTKVVNGKEVPELDTESFLEIDTILLASRHLYRMPYSIHEKSGLVSVPVPLDKVLSFERLDADPEKVEFDIPYLERDVERGEASDFVIQAFDFSPEVESDAPSIKRTFVVDDFTEAIPKECFPPCIQSMLSGLKDGKKRALFVLLNFLKSCNWDKDDIEQELREWNQRNPEPLRETILNSHLRYHLAKKEKVLPPNCSNSTYFGDMGHCSSSSLHRYTKNPVQYAKRIAKIKNEGKPLKSKKKENKEDDRRNTESAAGTDS